MLNVITNVPLVGVTVADSKAKSPRSAVVSVRGRGTVMVSVRGALVPPALVAVSCEVIEPAAEGVPLMTPVVALSEKPVPARVVAA